MTKRAESKPKGEHGKHRKKGLRIGTDAVKGINGVEDEKNDT